LNDNDKRLKVRYLFMLAVILLIFAYLISGLASLQLDNAEEYAESADSEKTLTKPYVAKDKPVPEFSGEKLDELRENMFLINIEKIMAKEKSQWENLHKPSK
ncbi:MAG: hypothetical protein II629_07500, partial [Ruminococcus sp.]|nr:hypothetical protein [Ruminococcus sp.]